MTRVFDILNRLFTFGLGMYLSVGGTMGFIRGKSLVSLMAGIVLAVPLILSSFRSAGQKSAMYASFLAAGFFAVRYYQTEKLFPGGYGLIASLFVSLLNCTQIQVRRDDLKKE